MADMVYVIKAGVLAQSQVQAESNPELSKLGEQLAEQDHQCWG